MNKKIIIILYSCITVMLLLFLGPLNYFKHGFYAETIDVNTIPSDSYHATIDLKDEVQTDFIPVNENFAGVMIYLKNQIDNNTGVIHLTLKDNHNKIIKNANVRIGDIPDSSWFEVRLDKKLKEGENYSLSFLAEGCTVYPQFQVVDSQFLPEESTQDQDILIAYAYSADTFSVQERLFFMLYICVFWMLLVSFLLENKKARAFGIFTLLTLILSWNYMYNSIDTENERFYEFEKESEGLVLGSVRAEQNRIWDEKSKREFGLGWYYDVVTNGVELDEECLVTDASYVEGYANDGKSIALLNNGYTISSSCAGNSIKFENGEVLKIKNNEAVFSDTGFVIIAVNLETEKILSENEFGKIKNIIFLNANGDELPKGWIQAYGSQVGLQGRIMRRIACWFEKDKVTQNLHLLCSFICALTFVSLSYLLTRKYNKVLGCCFYITFLLSPWITNFARNLYWVEFTWFLPMIAGLVLCMNVDNRKRRWLSYFAIFSAILVKCLCGYEYITTVMLGSVAFLISDFFVLVAEKRYDKAKVLGRIIVLAGMSALLGFFAAICVHGFLRGEGNLIAGVSFIYKNDVLRTTFGGSTTQYNPEIVDSLNASMWEVFGKYHKFETQLLVGIPGNIFVVLCILTVVTIIVDYRCHKRWNVQLLSLIIMLYLLPISWFLLGKSHSYCHPHLNYVLWYTGYIQICFYCAIKVGYHFLFETIRKNVKDSSIY